MIHSSDFPQAGNSLYGDQGNDTIFLWRAGLAIGARGFVSGGNGDDTIYQYTGDALIEGGNGDDSITDWDDGGENNETITIVGEHGDDTMTSQDATSVVDMDGGHGFDTCVNADTTTACEAAAPEPASVAAGAAIVAGDIAARRVHPLGHAGELADGNPIRVVNDRKWIDDPGQRRPPRPSPVAADGSA